jgi:hypothetical protein
MVTLGFFCVFISFVLFIMFMLALGSRAPNEAKRDKTLPPDETDRPA